jgi:hypothetical protein
MHLRDDHAGELITGIDLEHPTRHFDRSLAK